MNVLQLIALAGGFLEYADSKNVVIVRPEGDQTLYFRFSYADVIEKGRIEQNIALKPGDTVVVP
jgi:polysaccharide export outer membrane protein